MNKLKLWLAAAAVAVLGAAGIASVQAGAWSPSIAGGGTVVEKDATHDGALYAYGDVVRVEGTVDGDVYCAASGTVVISGTVNGDVLCAAQSVTIDGTVRQDVRVAGQAVDLSGQVGGNVSVAAQNFKTGRDLQVEGDINGVAQAADIAGTVGGGVVMAAQSLTIAGTVAGDLDVNVTMFKLGDDASVAGDVNYVAPREVTLRDDAVAGQVNYIGTSEGTKGPDAGSLARVLMSMAAMFVATAFVVAALAPRYVERSSRILGSQPVNTILLGFAAVFALPILALFMMISIVLLPLAIVLLLAWGIIFILSGVFTAYYIGAVLLRGKPNVLLRMLGGVLVLCVLAVIPLVNILTIFAATVVGAGALVATMVHGYRRPAYTVAEHRVSRGAKAKKS